MAGTLYVVSGQNERLQFDPGQMSFTSTPARGDGYTTIVVKPKRKPKPSPPAEPIETKGTLPPPPIDLDMSFIGGLPDEIEQRNLWLRDGSISPEVASIKGVVPLDHLNSWARAIPDGQDRVLILESDDGR